MYYCILCNKLHDKQIGKEELIFKSGFRYLNSAQYHAGICSVIPAAKPVEGVQSATA